MIMQCDVSNCDVQPAEDVNGKIFRYYCADTTCFCPINPATGLCVDLIGILTSCDLISSGSSHYRRRRPVPCRMRSQSSSELPFYTFPFLLMPDSVETGINIAANVKCFAGECAFDPATESSVLFSSSLIPSLGRLWGKSSAFSYSFCSSHFLLSFSTVAIDAAVGMEFRRVFFIT